MKKVLPILLVVLVLVVLGILGWFYISEQQKANTMSDLQTTPATRGNLVATVGATGMVRTDQTVFLTWQTSGTVEVIHVKVGDRVEPGQVIATLERTSLPQNAILAEADLINAQNALDDLLSSNTVTTQALQSVYQARQAIIEAERTLDVYDKKEYKDKLETARKDVIDREDKLTDAEEAFEPYADWDEDNDTRKRYEQELEDAQNAYDEAVRVVDLLELEKQAAQAALDNAQAVLADAERAYDRVKDGPNPDEVSILEARIAAAQAALDSTQIKASTAGTVTELSVQAGDKVSPGSLAVRIDNLDRLLVDVNVSEVDINRIKVGEEVNLTFDAIMEQEYHGLVSEVAQVGSINQGVVEFLVTVELTDADENVKPGMTAAINIIVEQLDNVLLVPNRAVRVVNGQRVVYILQNNELVTVRITLGASSDTESEVLDGSLKSGDLIVLNPPQFFEPGGGFFGR
ncbi:MAG TPA: efflux RND transporter periplasmic adaptor subunit [Anaerolineales bacterium]|nr:efflux RND transporter periplasmic adaptor subunit [Anaerolineales bacterium]